MGILVMGFRASVEAEKWARKDEADDAVRLSHRLGFRGELNFFVYVRFEAMDSTDSAIQLLTH